MKNRIWVEIPGFFRYEVSDHGEVRRHHSKTYQGGGNRLPPGRLLKSCINKDGYVSFCLKRDDGKYKTHPVSRFVALAFHGPRPTNQHHACHEDDDKENNKISNIYWGTPLTNSRDRSRNGHVQFALTRGQAAWVRLKFRFGSKKRVLARSLGVDVGTIDRVVENYHYGNA